ncbi:dihydroxyacetone kinase phosphoryl donor subunit DhaM [Staphylococcus coagulans]|uniref:dihydroxyacetone kinase phosphoryl donor subunit DhaM n=1 Tax=Staphylococcus coagulans TaxID=74706 RepID=UPI0015FC5169|nr:dihydroxyacetone kinase phosphoryl donor subunit DhaM [Staphylococcus coagulans]MBA8762488.1 PTS-dependent dihydroxyacetone kinase phosphotransferase subunit DhaM [Staphylococcus coagulans]
MTSIVIVSHSYKIAEGVKELNGQMTDNSVNIVAVGGLENQEIGTDFNRIFSAINNLKDDALCFYDIGSAGMNLDTVLEMYEGPHRIEKIEAPIVEGSFIASVAIKSNISMDDAIAEVKTQYK